MYYRILNKVWVYYRNCLIKSYYIGVSHQILLNINSDCVTTRSNAITIDTRLHIFACIFKLCMCYAYAYIY